MKNLFTYTLFSFTLVFFSACGDESNYVSGSATSTTQSTTSALNLSGSLADGYASSSNVCLDLNKNNICDTDEPNDTTDDNGKFTLKSPSLNTNPLVDVIAPKANQLKTTLDAEDNNDGFVISPITDLVSHALLNLHGENSLDLLDAKTIVADMFDIKTSQIGLDPMKDVKLFSVAKEIQHTKLLVEVLCKKYLNNTISELELSRSVKREMLEHSLDIQRILISLELKLGLEFDENARDFTYAQALELKETLRALTKDTDLDISNLDRVQKLLDSAQQKIYQMLLDSDSNTTLELQELDITSQSVTQSIFDTTGAILDEQSCVEGDGYIKLSNSYTSTPLTSDATNEISIKSNYAQKDTLDYSEVSIYYPVLTHEKTQSVALVFGDNYYFVFDEAWTQNTNKTIYIKTPKDDNGLHSCYRYTLDTISTSQLKSTKVFSYLEL